MEVSAGLFLLGQHAGGEENPAGYQNVSIPLPSLWQHEYNDTHPIGSKYVWVTAECVFSDEYFRMKLQWKSVSEEQERRNSRLRDYRSLIGEKRPLIEKRKKTSS